MSPRARRELGLAVLLCLAGAFVVLVTAGQTWTQVTVVSPLLGERQVPVPGADLVPGLRALGLVGLAGVVAVAATRRSGRVVVGVLLALTGAAVVVLAVGATGSPDVLATDAFRDAGGAPVGQVDGTGWPLVAALGGLLLSAAGVLVAVRGRSWAGLGRRYEPPAPAAAPAATERTLWEALDRGEDPTAR